MGTPQKDLTVDKMVLPVAPSRLSQALVNELMEYLRDELWPTPGGVAICFLDNRGLMVRFEAADDALPVDLELAQMVARDAYRHGQDSGTSTMITENACGNDVVPIRMGGVILRNVKGQVIGAIGLSGLSADGQKERYHLHRNLRRYLPDVCRLDEWAEFAHLLGKDDTVTDLAAAGNDAENQSGGHGEGKL